jgi:CubicO group peptidase (beta-lactamase class C family)
MNTSAATDALAQAKARVESRPGAAQLCVLRHGETVLDLSVRCEPDSLFLLWSAGKPFVTMAVHLLAERGQLDLDDPIHRHWPGYERHGKAAVTVRHVLRHRSGVPLSTGSVLRDALAMSDWDRSVRAAENASPKWPVDEATAYHILSYGFILGELVRRVDGRPIERFLREEIFTPADLRDTHLGLTPDLRTRRVSLQAPPRSVRRTSLADRWKLSRFERHASADQVIPAANTHSTARDIAKFYQLLLDESRDEPATPTPPATRTNLPRIFTPKTIAEARRPALPDSEPTAAAEPDRVIGHAVRWSQGLQLGWGTHPVTTSRPFGETAGRNVFGHNGSNYCNAWADPDHGLVFAYLTNLIDPRAEALRAQTQLSDLIRRAFST